ncbi:nodulin-26, partial [Rubripirellula amarantea]|nr:nodulin-26 [Rubripirellula amarantea]
NVGWSGDDVHGMARKVFDGPENGYARLMQDIETSKANVVVVAYGPSEASDGDESVQRFGPGLEKLIADLKASDKRVILVTPIAMPGYRVPGYEDAIARCQSVVRMVGEQADSPVVDLTWKPSPSEVIDSGLLPNDEGYASLADELADSLVGGKPCDQRHDKLAEAITAKNQLFFHRYRPQNETYLLLFRKHEQGNNAVELPQFDPLVESADQDVWAAAK